MGTRPKSPSFFLGRLLLFFVRFNLTSFAQYLRAVETRGGVAQACRAVPSGDDKVRKCCPREPCQGCLVSETAHSAHGRVCQGCLVSEKPHSAHERVCRGCLVSEKPRSAHERVCRCASGRRRVCVVTEESRHPYLRNSALHHRATKWYESVAQACLAALSGDDKCQKRCPGVSSWSGARKDSGTIKGA